MEFKLGPALLNSNRDSQESEHNVLQQHPFRTRAHVSVNDEESDTICFTTHMAVNFIFSQFILEHFTVLQRKIETSPTFTVSGRFTLNTEIDQRISVSPLPSRTQLSQTIVLYHAKIMTHFIKHFDSV